MIAALLLLAFNIDDIPLLAGRSHSAALSEAGGLKAGDDVRIAGVKVGKVTVGRPGRRPRAGRLPGRPRHRAGLGDLGARSASRPSSGRSTSPSSRPARASWTGDDPAGAHDSRVRRGRGVQRPRDDHRRDRHRAAGRGAGHASPTPSATRRTRCAPPSTAWAGCPAPSPPATTSCASCSTTPTASPACWPTATSEFVALIADGDLLLQELRERREDIHTLLVSTVDALRAAHRAGARQPRGHPAGPGEPQERARDAEGQPGQPRPQHRSCSRRSSGSSPTPPATAAGSTPTSTNLVPVPGRTREPDVSAPIDRAPRWRSSLVLVVALAVVLWPGGGHPRRCAPSSSAPSASTRAPTSASSASRSARSPRSRRAATVSSSRWSTTTSTPCRPTPRPSWSRRRSSATATSS